MLKADLHLHSGEDEKHKLGYDAKKLIDYAASNGFEILAFTFHDRLFYHKTISDYAKSKGILLIPGIEMMIEGKDVLVYNVNAQDIKGIDSFQKLRELKKRKGDKILIIAPHPFFATSRCLKGKLEKNIDIFDAIEYSHFYNRIVNFNRKAVKIAKKYNKPIVGTSDAHFLYQMDMTYAMVDSKKDVRSFIEAIKKHRVELKTRPMPMSMFGRILWWLLKTGVRFAFSR